jgi:hypothetical protein
MEERLNEARRARDAAEAERCVTLKRRVRVIAPAAHRSDDMVKQIETTQDTARKRLEYAAKLVVQLEAKCAHREHSFVTSLIHSFRTARRVDELKSDLAHVQAHNDELSAALTAAESRTLDAVGGGVAM